MDELLEILNPDGTGTGIAKPRKQIKKDGDWHRTVGIWIRNAAGEYLIQKRAPRGADAVGLWATTGGHVKYGDTPHDTIVREVEEEIGLRLDPSEVRPFFQQQIEYPQWADIWRVFRDVWIVEREVDIWGLAYQPEEVQYCAWMTPAQILQMYRSGEFFDYGAEYMARVLGE